MLIRLSDVFYSNISYDVDKCKIDNRRYDAFIKSCVKELECKGETICFNKQQIEEIKQYIELAEIRYDERDDCYYLFSKV